MALSLNTVSKIIPLRNNTPVVASGVGVGIQYTCKFEIYINDVLELTTQPAADQNGQCSIDLSYLLKDYFDNSLFVNQSAIIEAANNCLIKCRIVASSYNNSTLVETMNTGDFYIFNGVIQKWENFALTDYVNSHFLTKYRVTKTIALDGKGYLNIFAGTFGLTTDPNFTGIRFVSHQFDNSTKTLDINLIPASTSILSIEISPARLNAQQAGFISDSTNYFTVQEFAGNSEQFKIFVSHEQKIKNTFSILYKNSLGVTDSKDFILVSENNLTIDRQFYTNANENKLYDINITDEYKVFSDWVTEDISRSFKDLFTSPVHKVWNNSVLSDIILNNSDEVIQNRWNNKLIQYQIDFTYADQFRNQIE